MKISSTSSLMALLDSLHSKKGERSKKKSPCRLLKQAIWLSWMKQQTDISLDEVAEELFPDEGLENRTFRRWLNLEVSISTRAARKINDHFSGAANILLNPVFELLEPALSSNRLNEIETAFLCVKDDYRVWNLPAIAITNPRNHPISEFNTRALIARMDEWGFLALLILLRRTEFNKDVEFHFHYMKDLYQAFPSIAKNAGYKDHWQELLDCLTLISLKIPTTSWLVKPNSDLIEKQIHSKSFKTLGKRKFYFEAKFPE